MQDGGLRWRLMVPAGGDALRQERLTRDLYAALHQAEGVAVGFADVGQPSEPGHKGAGVGEVALWAATATAMVRPCPCRIPHPRRWDRVWALAEADRVAGIAWRRLARHDDRSCC